MPLTLRNKQMDIEVTEIIDRAGYMHKKLMDGVLHRLCMRYPTIMILRKMFNKKLLNVKFNAIASMMNQYLHELRS